MLKTSFRCHLAKFYSEQDLQRWFDPLLLYCDDVTNNITLIFPHTLFYTWFTTIGNKDFIKTAEQFFQKKITCCIKKYTRNCNRIYKKNDFAVPDSAQLANTNLQLPRTFENFLSNRKNDFPVITAKKIVQDPAHIPYIPFVIFGTPGAGKTHLLHSIAHAILPQHTIFINDFLNISKLKKCHICIDDIHHFTASIKAQEDIVTLIDRAIENKTLLAVTLNIHPSVCPGFTQKLRQHLLSGIVFELKQPDLDIRRQYIQRYNAVLTLSKKEILLIAQNYHDFRSIYGALNKIHAYKTFFNAQPADISQVLDMRKTGENNSPDNIISKIAIHFTLPVADILGSSKKRDVVLARQIAIFLCRELLWLSLSRIGQIFGNRDHSSIVYTIKKINELQKSDKNMNNLVSKLKLLCLSSSN